ncbi:DUF6602 domain-containing protein [Vibrio alfacsensis]|uniref:DUF6602 domain-containing protein n=1 Tax=Vibrio alfacsensis TaxID=1074311 RepID=UPI004068F18C
MSDKVKHELVDFMEAVTTGIQNEYKRIQRRVSEDPGTAGDEGEENWAELLRNWLPSNYEVVTKGRIISSKGQASPQIDIIVLKPCYPNYLKSKKLYLAGGVAAAFECKLTLKHQHIKQAFSTANKIRELLDTKASSPLKEMNSPIVYGILAHSHNWKSEGATPIENINKAVEQYDREFITKPAECLDFICVSDLATWSVMKFPAFMNVDTTKSPPRPINHPFPITHYGVTHSGMFQQGSAANSTTTPIGAFLGLLLNRMSIYDSPLKDFAQHFRSTGVWNGTSTICSRTWTLSIFSNEAQKEYHERNLSDPKVYLKEFL